MHTSAVQVEYIVLDLRQEFKKKSQLAIGFNLSLFFLEQENIQWRLMMLFKRFFSTCCAYLHSLYYTSVLIHRKSRTKYRSLQFYLCGFYMFSSRFQVFPWNTFARVSAACERFSMTSQRCPSVPSACKAEDWPAMLGCHRFSSCHMQAMPVGGTSCAMWCAGPFLGPSWGKNCRSLRQLGIQLGWKVRAGSKNVEYVCQVLESLQEWFRGNYKPFSRQEKWLNSLSLLFISKMSQPLP